MLGSITVFLAVYSPVLNRTGTIDASGALCAAFERCLHVLRMRGRCIHPELRRAAEKELSRFFSAFDIIVQLRRPRSGLLQAVCWKAAKGIGIGPSGLDLNPSKCSTRSIC